MGKQTPAPPAAPDPVALANAQGSANKDTAITQARLNAVDQVGPFGSVKYTETGGQGQQTGGGYYDDYGNYIPPTYDSGTPKFTQTISLSPEQQQLYNTQQGITQRAYDTAGQAIGNVQNTLSTPFSLQGLPSMATGVQSGAPQSGYGSVGPLFGIAPAGGVQRDFGDAGTIQSSLGPTGQNTNFSAGGGIQSGVGQTSFNGNIADVGGTQRNVNPANLNTNFGYNGSIQPQVASAGELISSVSPTGQVSNLGNVGNVQRGLDVSGIQQTPISAADFAQQGQQVQDALMSRFNQDIGRRQEDVESRLNAQGIQRGSQGFSNAQDDLSRARNDAFSQAVLAGSQEQDRLFGQQLAANQNQFGQRQAQGTFANQAQGQQFGQELSGSQFRNDALNNLLQQQLAAAQFGNSAQQQGYNQNLSNAQFNNAAQQQNYNQALSNAEFGNQAMNDQFQQQLAAAGFGNQAQAQDFGQAQTRMQAQNQAASDTFNQGLQAGNFFNSAQAQGFGQNQAQAQFGNQALQNLFAQQQAAQQAQNASQQQRYSQLLSRGTFANEAQEQIFGQNAAQQQAYNQAAQQQTANNAGQAAFYNTAQQQAFQQAQANAALQNQARQQSIAEQQLVRSQPINEIATLLGLGSGIQVPQGAPNFGVNVGQTDVMGAYGMQQQALQNQYNQQLQANNALWGGLGNLGGALGGAWIMSDARTKMIKRRVGQTPSGIPLWLYQYRHDPSRDIVGVMAQDVRKVNPMAVYDINGVLHVDMAMVA